MKTYNYIKRWSIAVYKDERETRCFTNGGMRHIKNLCDIAAWLKWLGSKKKSYKFSNIYPVFWGCVYLSIPVSTCILSYYPTLN